MNLLTGKTTFLLSRRNRLYSSVGMFIAAFLILTSAGCAAHPGPSLTDIALRYNPVKIAAGVQAKPGSLAWSPDGARLAFIGTALTIYDTRSRERTTLPIDNPYYVAWFSDGMLYALSRDKAGKIVLCSLDVKSTRVNTLKLDYNVDALYPALNGKTLITVSTTLKHLSFGTMISNQVILHDMTTDRSTIVYRFGKTYVQKNPDIASLTAWMHAGLSPLDGALLVMEHIKPPDVAFYTKVYSLDPATGNISEISSPDTRKIYISASWSPDGKRAAMTDGNGRLEVRDRFGKGMVFDSPMTGLYPSWNPGGSRIYFGGHLIDSDGKNEETLMTGAEASIAQWSPDGTALAVATGNDLLLFRNMHTAYIPPDGPLDTSLSGKLSLLKSLLDAGMLSPREFRERGGSLMRNEEGPSGENPSVERERLPKEEITEQE